MFKYQSTFSILTFLTCFSAVEGFLPSAQPMRRLHTLNMAGQSNVATLDKKLDSAIRSELNYKAGAADSELAKRFGQLAGAKVKTVGETFAEFTKILGHTINPLYKGMVTDIVGTTHLDVVNARFQRDPIWSLGIVEALNLLLKNYPEPDIRSKIESAFFKAIGLSEDDVRSDAAVALQWAETMTREEIETGLSGSGDSPLASLCSTIKSEKYWKYSRYFGIGLLKMMEKVGIQMDKDEVYPVLEDWMGTKLQKSPLSACADSDLYFKVRAKLDMMETMMKEIEIREKKRMAERLEEKAEQALRAAEREIQMQKEIELEAAKNRERTSA